MAGRPVDWLDSWLSDGEELDLATAPLFTDTASDGLGDAEEVGLGADPPPAATEGDDEVDRRGSPGVGDAGIDVFGGGICGDSGEGSGRQVGGVQDVCGAFGQATRDQAGVGDKQNVGAGYGAGEGTQLVERAGAEDRAD